MGNANLPTARIIHTTEISSTPTVHNGCVQAGYFVNTYAATWSIIMDMTAIILRILPDMWTILILNVHHFDSSVSRIILSGGTICFDGKV